MTAQAVNCPHTNAKIRRFARRAVIETARKYPFRRMSQAQFDQAVEATALQGLNDGFDDSLSGYGDDNSLAGLGELGKFSLKKIIKKIKKPLAIAAGVAAGGAALAYGTGLIGGSKKKGTVTVGPVVPVAGDTPPIIGPSAPGFATTALNTAAAVLPTVITTAGQVAIARAGAAQPGQFTPAFTSADGQELLQYQTAAALGVPQASYQAAPAYSGGGGGGGYSPTYAGSFSPGASAPGDAGGAVPESPIKKYLPWALGGGALLLVLLNNRRGR